MIPAGQRPHIVVFERATTTVDEYGDEISTWAVSARGFAKILFGTGQERREAAQEGSHQPATFMFNWTQDLAAVLPTDRMTAIGSEWDISGPPAFVGFNDEVHITAVRGV